MSTSAGNTKGPRELPDLDGYQVIGVLGEGGMGVVYLAIDPVHGGRKVAIKQIRRGRLGEEESRESLNREVQAVAALGLPNVTTVYTSNLDGPEPYFVMEY